MGIYSLFTNKRVFSLFWGRTETLVYLHSTLVATDLSIQHRSALKVSSQGQFIFIAFSLKSWHYLKFEGRSVKSS